LIAYQSPTLFIPLNRRLTEAQIKKVVVDDIESVIAHSPDGKLYFGVGLYCVGNNLRTIWETTIADHDTAIAHGKADGHGFTCVNIAGGNMGPRVRKQLFLSSPNTPVSQGKLERKHIKLIPTVR
jgi:hypothetical protein